jgi:leader peptidase (prepilin peptidase)/N-methyltransferase
MGFGDVKLAGIIGALLGSLSYSAVLIGGFSAFLISGLVALPMLITRRRSRKSALPFGPFMVIGALVALFFGAPLADMYLRVVLPT